MGKTSNETIPSVIIEVDGFKYDIAVDWHKGRIQCTLCLEWWKEELMTRDWCPDCREEKS